MDEDEYVDVWINNQKCEMSSDPKQTEDDIKALFGIHQNGPLFLKEISKDRYVPKRIQKINFTQN